MLAPDEVELLADTETLARLVPLAERTPARAAKLRQRSSRRALRRSFAQPPRRFAPRATADDASRPSRRYDGDGGDGRGRAHPFVLAAAQYDKPGEKVTAGRAVRCRAARRRAPQPSRAWPAGWSIAGQPADGARRRQPLLAAGLRHRAGEDGRGLRRRRASCPTHPELLDWLAREFVARGWDVKAMHRLIVTSATYRQSSRVTPELLERDPENRLLARGPRFRLAGRDDPRQGPGGRAGCSAEQVGGPSVKPYQPAGLWEDVHRSSAADEYVQDTGDDLYRRSLYTFWKRTCPPPALVDVRRARPRDLRASAEPRTNTPLQALVLLNDPTYVEAARELAERDDRERRAARTTGCARSGWRWPARRGRRAAILLTISTPSAGAFTAEPEAARQAAGRRRVAARSEALDPAELAAWTVVAQHDPEPRRDDHARTDEPRRTTSSTRRISRRSVADSPALLAHELRDGSVRAAWRRSSDRRCSPRGTAALPRLAGARRAPHFAPKAKRVIYLFQSGGPSQLDLFDYKPRLAEAARQGAARLDPHGPAAHRHDQRARRASRSSPSMFEFAQHGKGGTWVSELLPHTASDRRRPLRRPLDAHRGDQPRPGHHVHPDRHAAAGPAELRVVAELRPGQRGARTCRRSSCMISHGSGTDATRRLLDRLWGSGFLPSSHQGVKLRSGGDPVLYLSNPAGHRPRRCAATCSTASPS